MIRALLCVALAFLAHFALSYPAVAATLPRVRLETSAGTIVIELETERAPVTAENFLAYVDGRKFDGKTFYRAARNKKAPEYGLVQGGINHGSWARSSDRA
jgi:peptidyl-prolyl cis-trans isomerase A (cyclophilin A)